MRQVTVERGLLGEVSEYHRDYQPDKKNPGAGFAARQVEAGPFSEEELLGRSGPSAHQLREENEHEEDGAEKHEGGEEAEVLHGAGVEPEQAEEGGHGGEVADEERQHHLAQGFAPIAGLLVDVEEMQRVVGHDADEHRADAHHDEGYAAPEHGDARQREQGPEQDGCAHPQDVGQSAVME